MQCLLHALGVGLGGALHLVRIEVEDLGLLLLCRRAGTDHGDEQEQHGKLQSVQQRGLLGLAGAR
jgi:hypothetical protein